MAECEAVVIEAPVFFLVDACAPPFETVGIGGTAAEVAGKVVGYLPGLGFAVREALGVGCEVYQGVVDGKFDDLGAFADTVAVAHLHFDLVGAGHDEDVLINLTGRD